MSKKKKLKDQLTINLINQTQSSPQSPWAYHENTCCILFDGLSMIESIPGYQYLIFVCCVPGPRRSRRTSRGEWTRATTPPPPPRPPDTRWARPTTRSRGARWRAGAGAGTPWPRSASRGASRASSAGASTDTPRLQCKPDFNFCKYLLFYFLHSNSNVPWTFLDLHIFKWQRWTCKTLSFI